MATTPPTIAALALIPDPRAIFDDLLGFEAQIQVAQLVVFIGYFWLSQKHAFQHLSKLQMIQLVAGWMVDASTP
ncbi:MAG: hypothetical protein R3B74_01165 [Nitrospirales bacterium]|nr:hypothetical protein [Nitrospirales bacterium]